MKRLRSSDDLDSYGEKTVAKDSKSNPSRSSSTHRSFYYKSENAREGLSSSVSRSLFRYDRDRSVGDDDGRETLRQVRKRPELEFESFDRRKGFDRYRDAYSGDRTGMHRSESFSAPRREFPKGFRSERDRSRREGSVSSWRRFGVKEFEDGGRGGISGGSRSGLEIVKNSNSNSPKNALRDVKSPSWSRDSNSEQSRLKLSPSGGVGDGKSVSKSRSPTWSKDSGSEQSKSVEVRKIEELQVESGSSSEMEEGELEPEPDTKAELGQKSGAENEAKQGIGLDGEVKEVESVNTIVEYEEEEKASKESVSGRKDVGEKVEELPNCQNDLIEEVDCVANDENGTKEEKLREGRECEEEVNKNVDDDKSLSLEEESKEEKGIDLEVKGEDVELHQANKGAEEENGGAEMSSAPVVERLIQNFKDKGKSVAVVTLTHVAESVEDVTCIEKESREVATSMDNDMEGPSTRGFELFSTSPVLKWEKTEQTGIGSKKDEKLGMESLDLSLSLPNVLLPIGACDSTAAPGSPSHARSVQSFSTFCTNSDGFTASMSFSGSQSFYHNPSCSLTQNSMDNYEQSVGSRPIFQGIDQGAWQGQSQNESKHKDVPLYQRILMNGNGSLHQPQSLQGVSNGQAVHGQHHRAAEGGSKTPNGPERQLSLKKQLSGGHPKHHGDVRSPSHSAGSHEIGSNYSFDKKRAMREKHGGNLYRSSSMKEQEQLMIGGADFVESIIMKIVSEPVHVMARKFHEMTGQSMACLKESICEIMLNADKHGQLYAFQKVLKNRSDLTLEMLLKSHRAQLEILVALKTGLSDFLQQENNIASSDLAEIFLNLRCRNLTCRSLLPVDECDCKVCAQKSGFCSACMCLVCSKFDMASNTCSWVGCDVCLHWCHADCGLRESYIRNGHSATGAQGTTEMQFQCVACDHPSEMFGFVKEVFQNFAKEWTAETLSRELKYVKRIFSASKDLRGKRLHEIADQMLARLANKANLSEVYNYITGFLTESNSSMFGNTSVFSGKEQGKGSNGIGGPSQDTTWLKSAYSEKALHLERTASILPSFNIDRNDKCPMESELHRTAPKGPLFDELESIVRIKQAEAKMFQARADDARREAEGLNRIAIAKNEKIEEEYTSRIAKLRLAEAEEVRKQKLEQLQALERAHREYFNMKMRMEGDIKDLLLKMEATKRNLAM